MTSGRSNESTYFQRMRFRVALWTQARLMPVLIRHRDLNAVLVLAQARGHSRAPMDAAYIIKHVRRTTRRPWLMRGNRCLRQGLLGFRFLSEAGFNPELHFGIDPNSMRAADLAAHCWIMVDGKPALSEPQPGMVTVLVHPQSDRSGVIYG
jgi:hypothetical protein